MTEARPGPEHSHLRPLSLSLSDRSTLTYAAALLPLFSYRAAFMLKQLAVQGEYPVFGGGKVVG